MWELAKPSSHGGNSVRRILTFFLTALMAAFLWILFSAPLSHAETQTATWEGNSLTYASNQYTSGGVTTNKNGLNLPDGSTYYTYIPVTPDKANGKVNIIYFTTGQDPGTATSAQYVEYDLNMVREPYVFSNPHNQQTITIDAAQTTSGTTCAIQGVGWIVCNISTFLANGMDWIFNNILQSFVEVRPISTQTKDNDLYTAWGVMRNIANVAFIIVFLIIIYSQLTSTGINNYGLKKLVPRLIIAAVAVNLSYYICALAIDLSNILGVSIQDLLVSLRTDLYHVTTQGTQGSNSWSSVTSFVLSGGGVAAAAGLAGVTGTVAAFTITGGSATSAIFLLLPALVGLILAVLLVFLILAARQAIIIILLIIAPLAFVAYLLPNTEKWFKKWLDMFITMMVFFPLFSLIFAGSQLAGSLIIANASSLTTYILGMIVQVAPLVMTPWLLRISGSALQTVAKIGQGVNKRLVAGTAAWSKPRALAYKQDALNANLRTGNFARRFGRWGNYRQEMVKQRGAETRGADAYNSRRSAATRQGQRRMIRDAKNQANYNLVQSMREKALDDLNAGSTEGLQQLRVMRGNPLVGARNIEDYLTPAGTMRDRYVDKAAGIKTGRFVARSMKATIAANSYANVIKQADSRAKHLYEEAFAEEMRTNQVMRQQAGGIDTHDQAGANIALASAINVVDKAAGEDLSAAAPVVASYNFSNQGMYDLAVNGSASNGRGENLSGPLFQKYAFSYAAKIGIASTIMDTIINAHVPDDDGIRDSFKGTLDNNNSSVKGVAFWAVDDSVKQRIISRQPIDLSTIMDVMRTMVDKKKLSPELLSTQDPLTLQILQQAVANDPVRRAELKAIAQAIIDDAPLANKMKRDAATEIEKIAR